MDGPDKTIIVAVSYALPAQQVIVPLTIPDGSTAGEAVTLSGLKERFPAMGGRPALARFGKSLSWDASLENHDRVDILRALLADPKEFRRRRAERQRGKAGKP